VKKRPLIPGSADQWNLEHLAGHYDSLRDVEQMAHYSILAGLIKHFKVGRTILDIGCGEGLLLDHVGKEDFKSYLGVDISEVALRNAELRSNKKASFLLADAKSLKLRERFDCIVFNEILYSFPNPLEVIDHYRPLLKKNGCFLTSNFIWSRKITSLINRLNSSYNCRHQVRVSNECGTWVCAIYKR